MADPSDISEAVAKAFEELNKKLGDANLRWGGLDKAVDSLRIRMNATVKDYTDDSAAYKRVMRERKKEEDEIRKRSREGSLTYRESMVELNKLNAKVKEVIPDDYKQNFENYIQNQNVFNELIFDGNSFLVKFNKEIQIGSQVLGGLGNAAVKIFGAYRSGESEIKMAGSTTAAAAGAFFAATGGVGKALTGIGEAAMGAAPFLAETGPFALALAGAGLGLTVLGKVLDQGSDKLNQLTQQAIPILTSEVDKLYQSFNAISSTGAIFAGGIESMNNAARSVNLTLPQFAEVLKENSGNLAMLGISTTEAAKRMGDVGTVMRKNKTTEELQRLGFSFKEQAGLIADTMAMMRQSGGSLTASNDVVAEQTRKYAENLRIVSAITGEDAKKKEAQVRDQANELAFQQKLAGMDATQRQNVIAAMENMSDAQRKAFMEVTVFGQAVTPASAYAMSNIRGFGDSVKQASQEFMAGTLDAESMRRNNATYGEAIKQSILSATDLARAGMVEGIGGFVKDLKGLFQNELSYRNVFTKDAIDAAEKAVKDQSTATSKLTSDMLSAAQAGQDMALTIQQAVLDSGVLTTFAGTIADVTEKIANTLKEFATTSPASGAFRSLGITNAQQQNLITAAQQGRQANLGLFEGGSLRNTLAGMNEDQLNALTRQSNTSLENLAIAAGFRNLDDFRRSQQAVASEQQYNSENLPQFYGGGLASGPAGGYLARLHGTEAVLPEDLTTMLVDSAKSAQAVRDTLPSSMVRPDRNEDLLVALNDKFEQMIDIMDDVARYTKDTSHRIM